MLNVAKTIKDLREKFGLTQQQLAKAVFVEPKVLQMWENAELSPDIKAFERILDVFGYSLEMDLVKKDNTIKLPFFYSPTPLKQIVEMEVDDLVDYILVTQKDDIIANICGLDEDSIEVISLLPSNKLRELIYKKVSNCDRLTIYFKLEKKYYGVEQKVVNFMKEITSRLEHIAKTKYSEVKLVRYIDIDVDYLDNGSFYFSNIKFFGLDLNTPLDISMEEINTDQLGNNSPLDCCFDNPYNIGFSVKMMYLYPNL